MTTPQHNAADRIFVSVRRRLLPTLPAVKIVGGALIENMRCAARSPAAAVVAQHPSGQEVTHHGTASAQA